jgi:putative NIF3 family GTP cyclohydrolase 1 type 2
MKTTDISRRTFALMAGASVLAGSAGFGSGNACGSGGHNLSNPVATDFVDEANAPITARQVIERIKQNVGVSWRSTTVDTFKAGNPDTRVKGIATSFMATLDVLQRAAAQQMNLVITHEPTFYNHQDQTDQLTSDPVYQFKQDFIRKNDLVVWRFHDHWHARKPDAMLVGLAQIVGWKPDERDHAEGFYTLPSTTLGEMAKDIEHRLNIRTIRVIGDPQLKVGRLAVSPGYTGLETVMETLPKADVFICGELREWEGVEYIQDAIASGQRKGMIVLGHVASEDPGMTICAAWLKTFIAEVPVTWISVGEPFWRPS